MTQTKAIGSGPIFFFTADGTLIDLPIGSVYFDENGIGTTRPADSSSAKLLDWLKYLAKRGDIVPATTPVPAQSLIARAVTAGPPGNRIDIEVRRSVADATKVDITVTQTDTYEALTLASLASIDTSACLLKVKTNTAGAPDPAALDPVPVGGTAADPIWVLSDDTAGKTASLEPKRKGTGFAAADFRVTVSNVQAAAGGATFTLTVKWSKTVQNLAMTGATRIPDALSAFQYLVTFEAPADGYKLPRPGTLTLTGGRDAVAAAKASATLLAND